MKRSNAVSSARRTQRRNLYTAPSNIRRKIMSCRLSKELRLKYKVRSLPIRKNDEITILKGKAKKKSGKVTTVYRRRWVVYVDKVTKDKQNGQTVNIPIKPSYCRIEKLHLDKDRKDLLERCAANSDKKNKVKKADVNMVE
jgi:large subunit ribosomal protein L26e